jgi:hypothetical protein
MHFTLPSPCKVEEQRDRAGVERLKKMEVAMKEDQAKNI